jgi:hypothetical protein
VAPTVEEALSEVDGLIAQRRRDKAESNARFDAEIEQLMIERDGLARNQARREGKPLPATLTVTTNPGPTGPTGTGSFIVTTGGTGGPPPDYSWIGLDRTAAVKRAMEELKQPLDRNDIARVLRSHGRDDELNDISAALSYLRRSQRAKRLETGKWILQAATAVALAAAGGQAGVAAGAALAAAIPPGSESAIEAASSALRAGVEVPTP